MNPKYWVLTIYILMSFYDNTGIKKNLLIMIYKFIVSIKHLNFIREYLRSKEIMKLLFSLKIFRIIYSLNILFINCKIYHKISFLIKYSSVLKNFLIWNIVWIFSSMAFFKSFSPIVCFDIYQIFRLFTQNFTNQLSLYIKVFLI
jgi:hypothetical protein